MKHCEVILYPEDGWDDDKIMQAIMIKKSIKDYAFIRHDADLDDNGCLKKQHYHLYLNFGNNNVEGKHIAAWFSISENKVERIKSNKLSVVQYYLHLNEPAKHQYEIDDMVASFDVKKFLDEHSRSASLDTLLRMCADGTITRLNYCLHIDPVTYAKHQAQFNRAWEYYDSARQINEGVLRNCAVTWIYGNTAVGKTTLCQMIAQNENMSVCFSATGNDPVSHYSGQDIFVLDDLRPDSPFTFDELLKVIDPNFVSPTKSRYYNKVLRCKRIIITSILSPAQFAKSSSTASFEDSAQLYRRLSEIWMVTRAGIEISVYDLTIGMFRIIGNCKNPVSETVTNDYKKNFTPGETLINNIIKFNIKG